MLKNRGNDCGAVANIHAIVVATLLFVMGMVSPIAAQRIELESRGALGMGGGWESSAATPNSSIGARVQFSWARWASYTQVSRRSYTQVCPLITAECPSGVATETSAGGVHISGEEGGRRREISLGVGVLKWRVTDPFIEAETRLRIPVANRVDFSFGARGMATYGAPARGFRDPWNVDLTAGLSIMLR